MKLTMGQLNKLLNQHTGTGYILIKTNDKTIHIADIGINRRGDWYIGLDARPLTQGLNSIAKEVRVDFYKCENCGKVFDEFEMNFKAAQEDKKTLCRECRGELGVRKAVKRGMTETMFINPEIE